MEGVLGGARLQVKQAEEAVLRKGLNVRSHPALWSDRDSILSRRHVWEQIWGRDAGQSELGSDRSWAAFFKSLSPLPSLISLWKLLGCCIKTGPWPNIKFWLKISSLIYYIFFKLKINFWYILSSVDKSMSPSTGVEFIFITSKTSTCISPASFTWKHLCSFLLLLPTYSIRSSSYKVHAWATFWEIVKLFLFSD